MPASDDKAFRMPVESKHSTDIGLSVIAFPCAAVGLVIMLDITWVLHFARRTLKVHPRTKHGTNKPKHAAQNRSIVRAYYIKPFKAW